MHYLPVTLPRHVRHRDTHLGANTNMHILPFGCGAVHRGSNLGRLL